MYLKCSKKEIEIKELTTRKEKWKSLKFVLEPLTYGIKISKKRMWSTYFFCQRVDENDIIMKKYENIKSEKRKFFLKKYNIYYLPTNTIKSYKIGDKLILTKKRS